MRNLVWVPLFALTVASYGQTPRAANLSGTGSVLPANVKAVEFSVYTAQLPICTGTATCRFTGSNDVNRPQLWDLEVPVASDQEILTVSYQVPRITDHARFGHLRLARLDRNHLRLEIAARGNAQATVEVSVLIATRRDVVAEIPNTVALGNEVVFPSISAFAAAINADNRLQEVRCPGNQVLRGFYVGARHGEVRYLCSPIVFAHNEGSR